MITLSYWKLILIMLFCVGFGVYIEVMFRHIKNMTNRYDGGEP